MGTVKREVGLSALDPPPSLYVLLSFKKLSFFNNIMQGMNAVDVEFPVQFLILISRDAKFLGCFLSAFEEGACCAQYHG